MIVFSRSFIRKRVISLATSASVSATSFALAQDPPRTHHVHGPMPIQYVADRSTGSEERPVLSENDAAMSKTTADVTIKPAGDIDRDLFAMMVPHHQGAVDAANTERKNDLNEQLRRRARKSVASLQQGGMATRNAASKGQSSAEQSSKQPRAAELSSQSVRTDGSVTLGG